MRMSFILPGLALASVLTMGAANNAPLGEEKARELMPWNVDATHTEINFSVKHFFTPVTGTFRSFKVDLVFDPEAYPNMTFESTSVRQISPDQLVATGNLTIKETTKEVELGINLLGITDLPAEMQEMMGGVAHVASFEASTLVDRRDFEVGVANWAQTMIVGGEVNISISLEANHN